MSRRTDIPKNYLDPEVATGTVALPISKIKKTVKADEDVFQVNKQASFLLTVATEMFIQYLSGQGVKALQAERKARKTLQYKDLASAVARIDNLEFLSDVIPPITATKVNREKKAPKSRKKTTDDSKQTKLTLGAPRVVPVLTESGGDEAAEVGEDSEAISREPEGAEDDGEPSASPQHSRKSKERGTTPETNDIEMGNS